MTIDYNLQKIHKIIDEHQEEYYPDYYPDYACETDKEYYEYLCNEDYIYEEITYNNKWYDIAMRVVELNGRFIAYFVSIPKCDFIDSEFKQIYEPDFTNLYEVFPKQIVSTVYI